LIPHRNAIDHEYDIQVALATNDNINGVRRSNAFVKLTHFNMLEGFPPDIMHDFLEGTLVYNFGLIMKHFKSESILPFSQLNIDLNSFKYGRTDKNRLKPDQFTIAAYDTPKGKL
jgi:hypothetical protein